MIARLRGRVASIEGLQVYLDVQGVIYEVLVPASILQQVKARVAGASDASLELVIYYYHQLEVGRGLPTLIGFLNELEKEFFLRFISVSGIGPKAAVKAMTLPIPQIAQAIHQGDVAALKALKGIGPQRAREIVAKLQGQVGKFGLIPSPPAAAVEEPVADGGEEALSVLLQLQYKEVEARRMVQQACARNPAAQTAEEILNEVYRQKALEPAGAGV
jgi:Holliday junction DNA helicase RuvA